MGQKQDIPPETEHDLVNILLHSNSNIIMICIPAHVQPYDRLLPAAERSLLARQRDHTAPARNAGRLAV
jgi:hypothetical protein